MAKSESLSETRHAGEALSNFINLEGHRFTERCAPSPGLPQPSGVISRLSPGTVAVLERNALR